MPKTIRYSLALKNAPETFELKDGIIGHINVTYDDKHPLDENGQLIFDVWVHKHTSDIQEKLIEDFIEVQFKEINDEEE